MNDWCVWMKFVHKNHYGWGMVAHEITQADAEWMASTMLQPARAMPMRQKPEGPHHRPTELERYHKKA